MRAPREALIQFDSDMPAGRCPCRARPRGAVDACAPVAPPEGVYPWLKFCVFSTTIRSTAIRRAYARDDIPKIDQISRRHDHADAEQIDFKPGELLGSVSGELGLRKFLEDAGHTLVVTSDKDGPNSTFEKELPDAEIVISQPFWPAYMTKERIDKAKKLKLVVTAGIGSDHTDLQAAMDKGVTVAEVTYCNSISVVRAHRHDDPGAGAQLHPLLRLGGERRLEHRRLRRAIV